MTLSNQEKIEDYRKRREDILRILDEIVEIIRFHNIITHVQHLSFLECHTDMTKLDQKEDARTATNNFTFLKLESSV